ncbi:MAG: aldo/keto reductase [Pseudonocardiaceae bacterium]
MAQIPARSLGSLTTSAIGFGAMVLSPGMYGEIDDDRAVRALHAALDVGVTLVDVTGAQLREAHAVHPVTAVQTQWSMWQTPDQELLATARELGIGIVAWSPLGGGFLTGTVHQIAPDDFRTNVPRFSSTNLAANNQRYAPVRGIAADLGLTPGQLALAWLLHQDDHVVPIPGSRTPAHIAENTDAARVVLHPDTLAQIDEALARFDPTGEGALL